MKFTISSVLFSIITVLVNCDASRSVPQVCSSGINGAHCSSSYKYRSADGSCNNLNNPYWGTPNMPFDRLLPPAYEDGKCVPRGGFHSTLPSARIISTAYLPPDPTSNPDITDMVSIFGEFLDEDISQIVSDPFSPCCTNRKSNAYCWPIRIPSSDPFYEETDGCLNFIRSTQCQSNGICQQMNANTAYIDGSNIYGNNANEMKSLRTYEGGMLKSYTSSDGSLLSIDICLSSNCNGETSPSMMNTLFINEHNRIASAFAGMNSQWNDELIFQETRRVVIAELQQVTYNEFLPLVLGPADGIGLTSGFSTYDPTVNTRITNEYAAAAYLYNTSAYSRTPVQQNFNSFGADYVTQSIQRGRDNGLPPYTSYVNSFQQQQSSSTWSDLESIVDPNTLAILRDIYRDPNDIDLFVGGLSETTLPGVLNGPTFSYIRTLQFSRLKFGDRYFFTHGNQVTSFTQDQLNSIRRRALSDVICDNSQQASIQGNVFLGSSSTNPTISCTNGAQNTLDLSLFTQSTLGNNNNNNNVIGNLLDGVVSIVFELD